VTTRQTVETPEAGPRNSRGDRRVRHAARHDVTVGLITRLRNFAALEDGVAEPLMVLGEAGVTSGAAAPAATV
jgi:hypothetical protein